MGCVVIELLEGRPPYYNLEPMQALFRIVQDDMPPIPEGASAVRIIQSLLIGQKLTSGGIAGRKGFPISMFPEGSQSTYIGKDAG